MLSEALEALALSEWGSRVVSEVRCRGAEPKTQKLNSRSKKKRCHPPARPHRPGTSAETRGRRGTRMGFRAIGKGLWYGVMVDGEGFTGLTIEL